MPFLPPNQQRQSTEGTSVVAILTTVQVNNKIICYNSNNNNHRFTAIIQVFILHYVLIKWWCYFGGDDWSLFAVEYCLCFAMIVWSSDGSCKEWYCLDHIASMTDTLLFAVISSVCLQCFDTVDCASGRASGLYKFEWWGVGVVICLDWGAGCLHMVQLMPLPSQIPSFLPHLNPDWFYLSGTGLPRLSWVKQV